MNTLCFIALHNRCGINKYALEAIRAKETNTVFELHMDDIGNSKEKAIEKFLNLIVLQANPTDKIILFMDFNLGFSGFNVDVAHGILKFIAEENLGFTFITPPTLLLTGSGGTEFTAPKDIPLLVPDPESKDHMKFTLNLELKINEPPVHKIIKLERGNPPDKKEVVDLGRSFHAQKKIGVDTAKIPVTELASPTLTIDSPTSPISSPSLVSSVSPISSISSLSPISCISLLPQRLFTPPKDNLVAVKAETKPALPDAKKIPEESNDTTPKLFQKRGDKKKKGRENARWCRIL